MGTYKEGQKAFLPLSKVPPKFPLKRVREEASKSKLCLSSPHLVKSFADDLTVISSNIADHSAALLEIDKKATDLDLSLRPDKYVSQFYRMAIGWIQTLDPFEFHLWMAQPVTSLKPHQNPRPPVALNSIPIKSHFCQETRVKTTYCSCKHWSETNQRWIQNLDSKTVTLFGSISPVLTNGWSHFSKLLTQNPREANQVHKKMAKPALLLYHCCCISPWCSQTAVPPRASKVVYILCCHPSSSPVTQPSRNACRSWRTLTSSTGWIYPLQYSYIPWSCTRLNFIYIYSCCEKDCNIVSQKDPQWSPDCFTWPP